LFFGKILETHPEDGFVAACITNSIWKNGQMGKTVCKEIDKNVYCVRLCKNADFCNGTKNSAQAILPKMILIAQIAFGFIIWFYLS
jgi:hypothetical protein